MTISYYIIVVLFSDFWSFIIQKYNILDEKSKLSRKFLIKINRGKVVGGPKKDPDISMVVVSTGDTRIGKMCYD